MKVVMFSSIICIGIIVVVIDKLYTSAFENLSQENQNTTRPAPTTETEYDNVTNSLDGEVNITTSKPVSDPVPTADTTNSTAWSLVQEVNYTKLGREKLEEALLILDSGVWDFDRRTSDGDSIFTRKLPDGHTVIRLTGVVDFPAEELFYLLFFGMADFPKWNPSFVECRILKKIDDHTDISYQVSANAARGYVSSRDFVTLRHWIKQDNNYITSTCSVDYPGAPKDLEYTRGENGPGCWELRPMKSDRFKTEFRWLLNTKLNGWIPHIVADSAFKKFMAKYMVCLRQYCNSLKEKKTKLSTS